MVTNSNFFIYIESQIDIKMQNISNIDCLKCLFVCSDEFFLTFFYVTKRTYTTLFSLIQKNAFRSHFRNGSNLILFSDFHLVWHVFVPGFCMENTILHVEKSIRPTLFLDSLSMFNINVSGFFIWNSTFCDYFKNFRIKYLYSVLGIFTHLFISFFFHFVCLQQLAVVVIQDSNEIVIPQVSLLLIQAQM